MTDSLPIRTITLENGLLLNFYNRSNRYFGDFHRVLIVVEGSIDLELFLTDEMKQRVENLPGSILYRRQLERMGVTSDRLEETGFELIESFFAASKSYLERPDIFEKLLKKRLLEKGRRKVSSLKGKL